jgi:hypothetical protein
MRHFLVKKTGCAQQDEMTAFFINSALARRPAKSLTEGQAAAD